MSSHIPVFPHGDVGVLVADFEHLGGPYDAPQTTLLNALQQAARKIPDVHVAALGQPITSREEAQALSDRYRATMVIYGCSTGESVTASYVITPRFSEVRTLLAGDFPVSHADIESFDGFVAAGLDAPYILGLTAGQLRYFRGDDRAALAAFSVALYSLNPARRDMLRAADLYFYRGNVYSRLGAYERAVVEYDQAILLNPASVEARMNRALAGMNLGKTAEALDDFCQVIALAPDYTEAYSRRGMIRGRLGAYDDAIDDFSQVIERTSDKAAALVSRAMAYTGQGDHEAALADLSRAITLNPEYAPAYANRGFAWGVLKDYARAVTDFDAAIRLNPDDAQACYGRGEAHYFAGEFDRAVADFTRAVELVPDHSLAYLARAGTYERLGQTLPAAADYWQYIRLNQQDSVQQDAVADEATLTLEMNQGRVHLIPLALKAGQALTVTATRIAEGEVDPLIVLLDTHGNPAIGNDDFTDWNAAIHDFMPAEAGIYTLVVSHAAAGSDGQIEVIVRCVGGK